MAWRVPALPLLMRTIRRLTPLLIAAGGLASLAGLLTVAGAGQDLPLSPLPAATRGPVRIAFTRDGARAVVSEGDEGTVAVINAVTGAVLRRIPTGGEQPDGVAAGADGTAVVANRFSGSVARLDLNSGKRLGLLSLRGEPSDVVLSRDGKTAFVSVGQLDQVAVLDLPELRIRCRLAVGRRPRSLALTPDGRLLLVANLQGGTVNVIDTATLKEVRHIPLTGVNLRGITVTPDGRRAYVTGQIPANTRATANPLDIWTNTIFSLDLRPETLASDAPPDRGAAEGWIDFTTVASPDPDGIIALEPARVAVTLSGADQALIVRTPGPYMRTYDPVIEHRATVGARPRGIALTPDRRQLWVANELDSTLSVLDAATLEPVRRIALSIPARRDLRLRGRYVFGNARITSGHQFTCNSCHPDGGSDGLTWEFVHVPDGLRVRNSRNIRGGVTLTGPFRWTGHDSDIEVFIQDEVTRLMHGPKQDHDVLHALWNLVDQFPMPPNPHRAESGDLTARARRGQALFEGKAGCASCHAGDLRGGTGKRAWVGTSDPDESLDVPHLAGVYDSYPYLHDGRADTLEDIFLRHNAKQKHGQAHQLSNEELADLLRYVREL